MNQCARENLEVFIWLFRSFLGDLRGPILFLETVQKTFYCSIPPLGLRCHISAKCESWRWRTSYGNPPFWQGPEDKLRRCQLMSDVITNPIIQHNRAQGPFVSGDRWCYEQVYGRYAGCFRQDVKWVFPPNPAGNNVGYGGGIVRNWGKCAEECQKKSAEECEYWTWASTSCTNCIPNKCILFTGLVDQHIVALSGVPRTFLNPREASALGHISGDRSCVDIDYVERDTRSCFRKNVQWVFPPGDDIHQTNVGFGGGILSDWRKCNEECQNRVCDYWTYKPNILYLDQTKNVWEATSTCTVSCISSNCILFDAMQMGKTEDPTEVPATGSISGIRNCDWKVQPVPDAGQAEFHLGSCQVASGSQCHPQEVPGYRC